ncbi:surface-associated interspersed protein (SURFIN) [Plasmodium relictum]|uniref:Surface-associated interspersed protein (SURFIN) n=1 Tax=Plasmodium relictum TaxID=85471 RepID=A0A1J1GJX2_PLARL|nr:surface-associated interspersed protein (SURFIN) [Plasmodium relictum]CRG84024.1 surface-associated interspersed protein (SURFIN) [Plasmodium relictum]
MQEEKERIGGGKRKKRFTRNQDDKIKWMNDFNKEIDKLLEELKENDNDENCKKFLEFVDCRREYLMVSSPNNPFGNNSTSIEDNIRKESIKKLSNITNCYNTYSNNRGITIMLRLFDKYDKEKRKETKKFTKSDARCESLYLWFISRKIDLHNIMKGIPLDHTDIWDKLKSEELYGEIQNSINNRIKNCVISHFNTTKYNYIGNWMYAFGYEREIHNIKFKRGLINVTEYDNWLNEKEKNFTDPQTWNVTDIKPFNDHWKILKNETQEYRNKMVANLNCSLINDLNKAIITTQNSLFTTAKVSEIMNFSTISIVNDTSLPTKYASNKSPPTINPITPSSLIKSAFVAKKAGTMSVPTSTAVTTSKPTSSVFTLSPYATFTYVKNKAKNELASTLPPNALSATTSYSATTSKGISSTKISFSSFSNQIVTTQVPVLESHLSHNNSTSQNMSYSTTKSNILTTPSTVENLSSSISLLSSPSIVKTIKGTSTSPPSTLNNTPASATSFSTVNSNTPSTLPETTLMISSSPSTNFFTVQSEITSKNTYKYNISGTLNTTTSVTSIPHAPTIIPSYNVVHDKNPGVTLVVFSISLGTIIFGIFIFLLLCKCTPIGSWIGKRKSKKGKINKKKKKVQSKDASTTCIYSKRKSVENIKHLASSHGIQLPPCEITFENENVEEKEKCKEIELEGVRNEFIIQTREQTEEEKNKEGSIDDKEKKKADVKKEKSRHWNEERIKYEDSNVEDKVSINKKMYRKKVFIEIYMTILDECQKEEWELHREDFLRICLDEWKYDNILYEDLLEDENAVETKKEGCNSISLEGQKLFCNKYVGRNKEILEKWKREKWFENLKKEWEKEQEDYEQKRDGLELMEMKEKKNTMIEKQKIIWKHWLIKQRKWFMECYKERWFSEFLNQYEKEEWEYKKELPKENILNVKEIDRNIEKLKEEENYEIMNNKKKLIKKLWIEIHMMILEECKKEEWERNKDEFIKTSMNELKIEKNLDGKTDILEYVNEFSNNVISEKKDDIEKLKREEWFTQLKLKWKNNEEKYKKEINEKKLIEENGERTRNPMLERQKIIWKKHWEDIQKKWRENGNEEECFIMLDDEFENKEKEYKKEMHKIIEEKKEHERTEEECETIDSIPEERKKEIFRKGEGKTKKHKVSEMANIDKKFNYITMKKKLKWKTMLEIQMVVLEECKKEEWESNKKDFFQICIEEWTNKKALYEDILNKEKILNVDEVFDQIMLKKQTSLWKEWSERNMKMLEKWKKEEWFNKLKKEWKNYEKIYPEKIEEKKIEVLKNRIENPMLERQKRIWREWLRRHLGIIEEWNKESWFVEVLNDYEKEENKELQVKEIKNSSEKIEKDERIIDVVKEQLDETTKKKLICRLWIEIHMAIIEECKKEELESIKDEYLKLYIEEKKKKEEMYEKGMEKQERVDVSKKNKWNVLIEMEKKEKSKMVDIHKKTKWNILVEMKKRQWNSWKKQEWFQEWKENWKKEEMKHMEEGIRNPVLEQNVLWNKQWLEKQRNILKKNNKQNSPNGSMSQRYKKKEKIDNISSELDITIL